MLVFIFLTLLDLWGLIVIGGALGAFMTLLWIVFSALLGVSTIRACGMQAAEARDSPDVLAHAVLAVGGLALIIPGFFTDAFGLLCLWPPTRRVFARLLRGRMSARYWRFVPYVSPSDGGRGGPDTLEGEWRDNNNRP